MQLSPILLLHVCAGIIGVLSGAAAMSFRKGSSRHRLAGNLFFISMLTMSTAGVYLAIVKQKPGDILGGTLTFYLVATGWMTARRSEEKPDIFNWSTLLIALGLVAVTASFGVRAAISQTGMKYGYPPGVYAFLGSVALLAAVGDVRMLVRGGIFGRQRLARHLWRMCFALFIASASIFLARQHLFPALLRTTGTLYLLAFLPLVLIIFWLIRIRMSGGSKKAMTGGARAFPVQS